MTGITRMFLVSLHRANLETAICTQSLPVWWLQSSPCDMLGSHAKNTQMFQT